MAAILTGHQPRESNKLNSTCEMKGVGWISVSGDAMSLGRGAVKDGVEENSNKEQLIISSLFSLSKTLIYVSSDAMTKNIITSIF